MNMVEPSSDRSTFSKNPAGAALAGHVAEPVAGENRRIALALAGRVLEKELPVFSADRFRGVASPSSRRPETRFGEANTH
jgi:hypothetical protein